MPSPASAAGVDGGVPAGLHVLHPLRVGADRADSDRVADPQRRQRHLARQAAAAAGGLQDDDAHTEGRRAADAGAHEGQRHAVEGTEAVPDESVELHGW